MKSLEEFAEAVEVRRRAAKVRKQWSPIEKRRRQGLPPDAPRLLREYLLGSPSQIWPLAGCDSR
jgi:hypothetical protein